MLKECLQALINAILVYVVDSNQAGLVIGDIYIEDGTIVLSNGETETTVSFKTPFALYPVLNVTAIDKLHSDRSQALLTNPRPFGGFFVCACALNTERNFTQNEEIIHVFFLVGGVVNSIIRYVDCRSFTCACLAIFL